VPFTSTDLVVAASQVMLIAFLSINREVGYRSRGLSLD